MNRLEEEIRSKRSGKKRYNFTSLTGIQLGLAADPQQKMGATALAYKHLRRKKKDNSHLVLKKHQGTVNKRWTREADKKTKNIRGEKT